MAQRMQDAQDAQMNLAQLASANPAAAHDQTSPAALQARYLKANGCDCPFCQSTDIDGGEFGINDGRAWQEMSCLSCDAQWLDQYKLTGFVPNA